MIVTLPTVRWALSLALTAGVIMFAGALIGTAPMLAVGVAFALLAFALAFVAPVLHLTLLLFVAAIVPYSVQNAIGGPAGIVLADVLLLTGLARAAIVLLQHPLDRRRALCVVITVALLLVVVLQFVHALDLGRSRSDAGNEMRNVIGIASFLMALPILFDAPARARLFNGLAVVGLALGLWGIAQWVIDIPFAGDVGVREGVSLTTNGRGQIQGGAYAFPAAVVLSFAALISTHVKSTTGRVTLLAVLLLNSLSLILTFERAFWIGTAVGVLIVIARAGRAQRARAVLWAPAALLLVAGLFASVAPGQFTAAGERLVSVREYASDSSVSYRVIESEHVWTEIRERPIEGSGLAATIWWGRPAEGVPPDTYTYSHNAYLWLVWKLGLPGAALLALLIALAAGRAGLPGAQGPPEAMRRAAQAAIIVMLILGVTAPVFSSSATPLIGLLLALCLLPRDTASSA